MKFFTLNTGPDQHNWQLPMVEEVANKEQIRNANWVSNPEATSTSTLAILAVPDGNPHKPPLKVLNW